MKREKIVIILVLLVTFYSCRQETFPRHHVRKIGMDTLCKKFGKEEVEKWKPFKIYQTDSTWSLSSYHRPPKGYRVTRFMEVIIDKKEGNVVGVYFRKL